MGSLIGADEGLFRYEPTTGLPALAGMEEPDSVYCMHDLPDGGVLIGAVGSWFHYDLAIGLITVSLRNPRREPFFLQCPR